MKDLLMAAIVATSGCLLVTPFYIPPKQTSTPITQHNYHWSDHVKMLHGACSELAFLEQEMAYVQGGTPEQQIDLANGVYLECINQTKIAI